MKTPSKDNTPEVLGMIFSLLAAAALTWYAITVHHHYEQASIWARIEALPVLATELVLSGYYPFDEVVYTAYAVGFVMYLIIVGYLLLFALPNLYLSWRDRKPKTDLI